MAMSYSEEEKNSTNLENTVSWAAKVNKCGNFFSYHLQFTKRLNMILDAKILYSANLAFSQASVKKIRLISSSAADVNICIKSVILKDSWHAVQSSYKMTTCMTEKQTASQD